MARKNLLEGLLPQKLSADNLQGKESSVPESATPAFSHKGAIGAVSRSIAHLKSQAISDLDPEVVDDPIVSDRLQESDKSFAEFARNIEEYGQQVPILVRPHPGKEGRFQVAYGRRRLRAIKAAGKLVKAIVRPLTDEELVIAQGQENSARQDLSYIERSLYAYQLETKGFGRDIIMSALAVDKAALSHLISTSERIPADIIQKIGAAPKAGRDRWVQVAAALAEIANEKAVRQLLDTDMSSLSSDERFLRVFSILKQRPSRPRLPSANGWVSDDRAVSAAISKTPKKVTIELTKAQASPFGEWITANLDSLYGEFQKASKD